MVASTPKNSTIRQPLIRGEYEEYFSGWGRARRGAMPVAQQQNRLVQWLNCHGLTPSSGPRPLRSDSSRTLGWRCRK